MLRAVTPLHRDLRIQPNSVPEAILGEGYQDRRLLAVEWIQKRMRLWMRWHWRPQNDARAQSRLGNG